MSYLHTVVCSWGSEQLSSPPWHYSVTVFAWFGNRAINSNTSVALIPEHWAWRRRRSLAQFSAVGGKATALRIPACFSYHAVRHPLPHTRWGHVPINWGVSSHRGFSDGGAGPVTGTGRWCWCCGRWGKREILSGHRFLPRRTRCEMVCASAASGDQVRGVRRKEGKEQDRSRSTSVAELGLEGAFPLRKWMPFLQVNCFPGAKSCLC